MLAFSLTGMIACRSQELPVSGRWDIIEIINVDSAEVNNGKPFMPNIPIIIKDDLKGALLTPYINDKYQVQLDFDFSMNIVSIGSNDLEWLNGIYEFSIKQPQKGIEALILIEISTNLDGKEIVLVRGK
jgi:hypothetical protein